MDNSNISKLIRYKCKTCGNTCLESEHPDNSICGRCDTPDWKIMKFQEAYMAGQHDYVHPKGEI